MLGFISLLLVHLVLAAGLRRDYLYFSTPKSWEDAQNFCTLNYKGLAVITTEEENSRMRDDEGTPVSGWIGLKRSTSNVSIWLQEDGTENSFFWWKPSEPNNYMEKENCGEFTQDGWNDCECDKVLPFYCYRDVVLAMEKKTWDGAQDFCRTNHAALVSLVSESQIQLAEMESSRSQTNSVWTGLRFVNGQWLWMNKEPLGEHVLLPSCPAIPYRCGARNTITHVWENRDCNEKLNFICSD